MPRHRDDSTNYQIGIFLGCDWTVQDVADHLGITRQAIYMRQKDPEAKAIQKAAETWTRAAISKYVEKRIQAKEEDLAEKKKRLRNKGYKLIEKTLDQGLETEEVNPIHLKAAEMGIEREEGKPLDRKAILSQSEHTYRLEVDGDDLAGLLAEVAQINELRRKALPAFKDAEVVES